jgi:signal transduction histidine kinase
LVILRSKYRDRITIKKNYDRNAFIKAHEGRIHQVFLNVIHNAIQAINRKGEVEIKTQCITNQVITTITDTGIGISNENLSRITDPFFTTKPPHEGTGLGLSISQRIVSDYKGSIQFSSEPNQGTTVTIKFQLDQSSD